MTPVDRTVPPPAGAVRPFRFPAFDLHELDGGPTLLVAPDPTVPLVYIELLSLGGARLDPRGRAGLAALTGALLDEGTPSRSSTEIAAAAERVGGYLATGTDWDRTSVACGVMASHLEAALSLIGEVVREPTLPGDELERLRDRTLAEIRRRSVVPSTLAARQFAHALYGDHVYGFPILGTEATVSAIRRAEVERFYRERMVAAPMHLIVSGAVTLEQVRRLAAPAFEGLPRRPAESGRDEPPAGDLGPRVVLVDRPSAAQTELRVGHHGVARSHSDFTALTVMNSLLGGKFTSRLNLNLRERHGITYGVRSSFSRRVGGGPFTVAAAVATESAGLAVTEIRNELDRLCAAPVTTPELDETRSYILGVFPYTVQSLEGVAHRLQDIVVHELALDHWDRYPDEIVAVDAAALQRVAGAHLRPEQLTIVAVGPEADLRPQLEPFGEIRVWRPTEQPDPL